MDNLITIIIPVYNAEEYLDRNLKSIINQTYKNLEILAINDGSTDRSIKILKKYEKKDKRIIVIDKENEGVSITRNLGISMAKGKYVCFIDSDDYIKEDMIETMYNCIKEKKTEIVRCSYYKVMNDGQIKEECSREELIKNPIKNENFINRIINGEIKTFVVLLMIKNNLIKECSFDKNLKFMEDMLFYLNLLSRCTSLYIMSKPLYYYEYNPKSATNKIESNSKNIDNIIYINKYTKKYSFINKKVLDTKHSEAIINYLFILFCNKYDISKLIEKTELIQILDGCDINSLRIYNKLAIAFLRKKKYNCFYLIFYIRKVLKKMKK